MEKVERSYKCLALLHSRKGSAPFRVRVTQITQPYEAFSHMGEVR